MQPGDMEDSLSFGLDLAGLTKALLGPMVRSAMVVRQTGIDHLLAIAMVGPYLRGCPSTALEQTRHGEPWRKRAELSVR